MLIILLFCTYIYEEFSVIAIAVGIALLIVSLLVKNIGKHIFPFFLSAALVLSGTLFMANSMYKSDLPDRFDGKKCVVTGTVADEPSYENSRYRYIIELDSIDGEKADAKLMLSSHTKIDAQAYDRISVRATVYSIGGENNDVKLYYRSKGIYLGAYCYNGNDSLIEKAEKKPFLYIFIKLRNEIENRIIDKLPNEYGGIAVGMISGNKNFISDSTDDAIRNAGISPLFAVSGLHFSIWVAGLFSLLSLLKVNKRINSVACIVFALIFMALTGFTPSVCRAGIMLIVMLAGNLFFRKADPINSLGLAILILCTVNPLIVADLGFLLSVTATLGIILIYPVLNKRIILHLTNNIFEKILSAVLSVVFVSISAIIGTIPVMVLFIGSFSVFAVLTNLFVTFAATLCIIFAGMSALFYPIGFVSNATALISGVCAKYILWVVEAVNSFDVKLISTADIYCKAAVIIGMAVVCISFILFRKKMLVKSVCISLSGVIIVCSVCSYFYYRGLTEADILNLDDSIGIVISHNGKKYVISDKSDYDFYENDIREKLNATGYDDNELLLLCTGDATRCFQNLKLVKNTEFKKIVSPETNNYFNSICGKTAPVISKNINIGLFEKSSVRYVNTDDYSLAVFECEGIKILIIFSCGDAVKLPDELSQADVLVCGFIPYCTDLSKYNEVIFSANELKSEECRKYAQSNGAVALTTYSNGNISIKIKNGDYKITEQRRST